MREDPVTAAHEPRSNVLTYVYLLPCAGPEDLAKIGMTADPLGRWSAFSARWFECFDLERAWLVEAADRRDARRRENELHRAFAAQRCPMPLHLRGQFGGGTEWFRGVYDEAQARMRQWCEAGQATAVELGPLLAAQMAEQAHRLHEAHGAVGLLRRAAEKRRRLADHRARDEIPHGAGAGARRRLRWRARAGAARGPAPSA